MSVTGSPFRAVPREAWREDRQEIDRRDERENRHNGPHAERELEGHPTDGARARTPRVGSKGPPGWAGPALFQSVSELSL